MSQIDAENRQEIFSNVINELQRANEFRYADLLITINVFSCVAATIFVATVTKKWNKKRNHFTQIDAENRQEIFRMSSMNYNVQMNLDMPIIFNLPILIDRSKGNFPSNRDYMNRSNI